MGTGNLSKVYRWQMNLIRCSISYVIRELKIKTIVRTHSTLAGIAKL